MLVELLALSAAFTAGATILLLVAGRLEIPGPFSRVAVVAALALVIGVLSGHPLDRILPDNPGDPLLLVAAAVLILSLLTPLRWWAVGSVAFSALVVATAIYVVYLARITFVLAGGPIGLLLGLFLLAFEILALVLMTLSVFEMIDALCGQVRLPILPPQPSDWPVVAVQVPAHAEPPDLVIDTIRSLAALDYPRDRLVIQIIDNNTPEADLWKPLEDECEGLEGDGYRVHFAHLEDWPGFKAGALNWATAQLPADVEILAVVDADYVVAPGFLKATVPFFQDPSVGFVQTPQEYRAWEGSAFYRACHASLDYFFKIGMVSRALRNSIIFAGTMGLISRDAFNAIGGWDEAIITEDADASLRMLAAGLTGIYVPRAYGKGILPLTYEGLRKQRFRWSFGGIQILRKHWRSLLPWSKSGLNQRQRRDYLLGALWWFNDLLTLGFLVFIGATAAGVVTDRPFVVQLLSGPALVLPLLYLVLGLVRYLWGLRIAARIGLVEAAAALRINLSLAWIVTYACLRGLIEKKGVFLRTPKFAGSAAVASLRLVWVETLLALLAAGLAVAVFWKAGVSTLTLTLDTLLLWSVLIYGSATNYALGDPTRPPTSLRAKAAQQLRNDGPVAKAARQPRLALLAAGAAIVIAFLTQAGREVVQDPLILTPPENGPIFAFPGASGAIPSFAASPGSSFVEPSGSAAVSQPPGESPPPGSTPPGASTPPGSAPPGSAPPASAPPPSVAPSVAASIAASPSAGAGTEGSAALSEPSCRQDQAIVATRIGAAMPLTLTSLVPDVVTSPASPRVSSDA
jgi:cellulose synthase/poly-beta-1,6-N-acetylglucosamine synthase-like glycosyltransferase